MSFQPIATVQNQVPNYKNASPIRFSTQDSTVPWPFNNTVVDQTLWFLTIRRIPGSKMDVLVHDPTSLGPDAAVVDLSVSAAISAQVPYVVAPFAPTLSRTYEIGQLSASFDLQTYARIVASEAIHQKKFQIAGKVNPLRKLFGLEFIQGDGAAGRLFGLNQLGADGYAQTVTAGVGPLSRMREALKLIRTDDQRLSNLFIVCSNDFYWDVLRDAEGKAGTVPIEFKPNKRFGINHDILHYGSVPLCINDFTVIDNQANTFYVVDSTTVYGFVNETKPDVYIDEVKRQGESAIDVECTWFIQVVSETDLGLVISTP